MRYRRNWLAGLMLIALVFIVSLASPQRYEKDPKLAPTAEEYQMYSTLIKQFYVKPQYHLIVIEDRTFRYDPREEDNDQPWYDKPKGIVIDPTTIEDYGLKNTDHWVVDKDSFKLGVKCELVTSSDLWATFHGRMGQVEWLQFFDHHPDAPGFVMISRIGFNTQHNQAMLYVGSRCGPGCWDLHFLLMEKTGDAWKIKKELRKMGSS